MKRLNFLTTALIVVLLTTSGFVFGQDKIVPYSEVPSKIKTYVKKHFPNNQVLQAEVDYEGLRKEYEIILSDNIKLDFGRKDKIKNISAQSKLPDSVIPSKIREYVKANYPNNVIREWDLDDNIQSVELDNKVELEFSLKSDFLRIDI